MDDSEIKSRTQIYTVEDVRRILPHRYPFLMVDRILEKHETQPSRVGSWVLALKNCTANEPYFTGHFPHQMVMPGVMIVEAMAQAGALAVHRSSDPPPHTLIARIDSARFRKPVVPGDQLEIRAEVTKDRGRILMMSAWVKVAGQIVSEAELMASLTPRDEQTLI